MTCGHDRRSIAYSYLRFAVCKDINNFINTNTAFIFFQSLCEYKIKIRVLLENTNTANALFFIFNVPILAIRL